jgi:hypothetical protein
MNNYSRETSLPAYKENQAGKEAQKTRILQVIRDLGGRATLKQIEEVIQLPQSSISGRINDLIEDRKVKDTGEKTLYAGMRRKVFALLLPSVVNLSSFRQTTFFE